MPVKPTGLFKVGKSFVCEGVRLESGSVVDVTGFRNAHILIERRYLVPFRLQEHVSAPEVDIVDVDAEGFAETVAPSRCPKCDAFGDDPCLSASGRPTLTHAGRNV